MAIEGKPLIDQFVTSFTDANPAATGADFTATIDWKDGTPVTAGVIVAGAGGLFFDVTGTHTYDKEGVYNPVVTVRDVGGSALPNDPEIDVADAPLTSNGAPSIPALTGIPLDNGPGGRPVLATFTDGDNQANLIDFATPDLKVYWGDGTSSAFGDGNVSVGVFGAGPNGQTFFVKGNHTYASPGDYQILIDIVDPDGSKTEATSEAVVSPAPPPKIVFTAAAVTATEGQAQANIVVATFTAVPMVPAGDLTSRIDWGDGSPISAGTITLAGGVYTLTGNHTFAEAQTGAYPMSFTVVDKAGNPTSGTTNATVTDAKLSALTVIPLKATEGKPFNLVPVATFTDANPLAPASDFTASLDWGDGTSAGIVVRTGDTGAGSTFVVLASHTYNEEGPYTIGVKITDDESPATPASVNTPAAATVADAPLTVSIAGPIFAFPGVAIPATTHLITFTDANPLADVADFTVMVNWGDGTPAQNIPPTALGSGVFTVDAGHTYMNLGDFTLTVNVADVGGSKTIASADVDVDPSVVGGIGGGDAPPPPAARAMGIAPVAARSVTVGTGSSAVTSAHAATSIQGTSGSTSVANRAVVSNRPPAVAAPTLAEPWKLSVSSTQRAKAASRLALYDLALAQVSARSVRRLV
jgi:hypothetical protein